MDALGYVRRFMGWSLHGKVRLREHFSCIVAPPLRSCGACL
jgi:hypothetical protein